jgi:hypothetical protein
VDDDGKNDVFGDQVLPLALRLPALSKKYTALIFESPDVSPENFSHLEKSPK